MKLKDLKDVIDIDTDIAVSHKDEGDELPTFIGKWGDVGDKFKNEAWEKEVRLSSYSGILIEFQN